MRILLITLLAICLSGCKIKYLNSNDIEESIVYYNYKDTITISLTKEVIYLPLNTVENITLTDDYINIDNFMISHNKTDLKIFFCDLRIDSTKFNNLIDYIKLFQHTVTSPP